MSKKKKTHVNNTHPENQPQENDKQKKKKRLKKVREQLALEGKVRHELTDHEVFVRTGPHQDKRRKTRSRTKQDTKHQRDDD